MDDLKVYYFGCIAQTGHYLHSNPVPRTLEGRRELSRLEKENPWGLKIDTKLCPIKDKTEGRALLHHKDGWTAIAFWDYSVDRRGGSNSCLLATGTHDFTKMMELFKEHFPRVLSRFNFVITLVDQ